MKTMRGRLSETVMVGLVLGGYVGAAGAQGVGQTPGFPPSPSSSRRAGPLDDPGTPRLPASATEKMAIARNDERQKRLQADTAQLLALATKLKEDVDKTDKYTLSLDVVKRTAEIEKLAKSIRERMKD